MAILETIDAKMNAIKPISKEELERIENVLEIITSALNALKNENSIIKYNFDIAINLINQSVTNFGIIDLEKGMKDIKNVLIAKQKFNISELNLSEDQKRVIDNLKEKLETYKKELESIIDKNNNENYHREILENLEDLKNLFDGKGRRKYYTYDMLESLFEVIDYNDLSYQDMKELTGLLSVSKNKDNLDKEVTKEDVIELLKPYLEDKLKVGFIERHSKEICSLIDLDNARKILDLFKKENILDRFSLVGLMPILLKGRYEFISKFYYDEIMNKDDDSISIFFEDAMACVWINEKRATRRHVEGIRNSGRREEANGICAKISEVNKKDVDENIAFLKKNEDRLNGKYDLNNIKDLWVLTRPPWLLKKNLMLFREFCVSHVRPTAIAQMDLEGKIHLAVELGLLNPPRNKTFRNIELAIPKQREFNLNGDKRRVFSNSVLNYFQRNTSQLGRTSYSELIYWFYRIQQSSKEEFYKIFFSDKRAGTKSQDAFDSLEDQIIFSSAREMNRIISENFANKFYSGIIDNYSTYEEALKEYAESDESSIVSPYFSSSILNDEMVMKLEQFRSRDIIMTDNGREEIRSNAFAYVFGETIISRYKVLRYLSVLKGKYGYIDEDMLLTAIAYNSYFSKNDFDIIRDSIRKGRAL